MSPTVPSKAAGWPSALARATALAAVPLVLFGGSVTTLRAGMAVQGWIMPEGHFLWFFPLEQWFRNLPTFVEHTHRLFGSLVGLLAIATAAATFALRRPAVERAFALAALLAVCLQGTLGGLRVLENSPRLAFVHGVLAQAVFALLCASAWKLGGGRAHASTQLEGPSLPRAAWSALAVVLVQIAIGAWYRHGLRTGAFDDLDMPLSLHLVGALASFAVVLILAGRLQAASGGPAPLWTRWAFRLRALLLIQLALGMAAWLARDPRGLTPLEWTVSVAHVMVGALLLSQCLLAALAQARRHALGTAPFALGAGSGGRA